MLLVNRKRRYIRSFLQDYIVGLNNISQVKDRGTRVTLRNLWLQYFIDKAEIRCKHKLSNFQYDSLLNSLKTFYREHTRPDEK